MTSNNISAHVSRHLPTLMPGAPGFLALVVICGWPFAAIWMRRRGPSPAVKAHIARLYIDGVADAVVEVQVYGPVLRGEVDLVEALRRATVRATTWAPRALIDLFGQTTTAAKRWQDAPSDPQAAAAFNAVGERVIDALRVEVGLNRRRVRRVRAGEASGATTHHGRLWDSASAD